MQKQKELQFGEEARTSILNGITKLAKAVKCTLGPRGRNVIIRTEQGPLITKDGVTVSNSISLPDHWEDLGAEAIKQAAQQTNEIAGDGTSTSTILAEAILTLGQKAILEGEHPIIIKKSLEDTLPKVLNILKEHAKELTTSEEIKQVATISANGDTAIGQLIADAFQEVGHEGVITLEASNSPQTTLQITQGYSFDRGWLHHGFINEPDRQRTVLDNPLVWLINGTPSSAKHMEDLFPVLEYCSKNDQPILLIADNFENDILAALVVNAMRKTVKCLAIRIPGMHYQKEEAFKDLAALSNANLRSALAGDALLQNTNIDELGQVKKVISTRESTIIIAKPDNQISNRLIEIKGSIHEDITEFEKTTIEARLSKLTSGLALIKVGAVSELEMKEKKDRIEDALNATRAATKEGIVAGGGTALLYAASQLPISILTKSIQEPAKQIALNAGLTHITHENPNMGLDANKNEVVDMFDKGIIDPLKVTRAALENAVSVASTILTTETAISYQPLRE